MRISTVLHSFASWKERIFCTFADFFSAALDQSQYVYICTIALHAKRRAFQFQTTCQT